MARKNNNEIDDLIKQENIVEREVSQEMSESYLTYSLMTISSRALPSVYDGLKPVQRRILWSMFEENIKPNSSYKKSARIIGNVIGKYHPHGDGACYGAMTNMINDFDIRYPVVDGHGNFGSSDGDGAAAMRYTEAKLAPLAMEMLSDIKYDSVDMKLNFSEDEYEPVVLPAGIPYLLVNGCSGIATGYTTEIPPHNLNEVCDGVIATIKNPDITIDELVKKYIKGPDLPSYGYLVNDKSIMDLYTTGNASLKYQGSIITENNEETNNRQIIINELPPDIKKPKLLEKLYNRYVVNKDKKVIDVRDESEGNGCRIVLELHKTAIQELLIQDLFENAGLTKSKSYIIRAIVEQAPALLNLKQIIEYYISHRRSIIERRTRCILQKLLDRINILNGFKIVLNDVKKIVEIITDSNDEKEIYTRLTDEYSLNDKQIKSILSMELRTLSRMEKTKIENELNEKTLKANELNTILQSDANIDKQIISELREMKRKYGDERKTKIIEECDKPAEVIKDELPEQPMFIGLTNQNTLKAIPYDVFEKMIKSKSLKEKNVIFKQGIKCTTNDIFIIALNDGNYIKSDFSSIVSNLITFEKGVKIVSITQFNENDENVLVFVSKKGLIKKIKINSFKSKLLKITNMFDLNKDEIIACRIAEDNDSNVITISTEQGLVHRFYLRGFSSTSQTAKPLGCINMDDSDNIVSFDITPIENDKDLKVILYVRFKSGKNGSLVLKGDDFTIKNRMAKGVKSITFYKNNEGIIEDMAVVNDNFFVINSNGELVLKKYSDIDTQQKCSKPAEIDYQILSTKLLL